MRRVRVLLAIILAGMALLGLAVPVHAIDTSSANVTYVFTDNFTITFGGPLLFEATANTTSIEEAIISAGESGANIIADKMQDILDDSLELVLILALAGFAYWHRDRLLYILSGFAFVIYGFSYWQTSATMSIILVLAGIYGWAKAKWGKAA